MDDEGGSMLGERVDEELHPEGGDRRQVSIRVEGIDDEKLRSAVSGRVADVVTPAGHGMGGAPPARRAEPQDAQLTIEVGLGGFTADAQREREIGEAVRASVTDEVGASETSLRSAGTVDLMVCASDVPGDRLEPLSRIPWWNENGQWMPNPAGFEDYVVAVFADRWNALQLRVFNGAMSDPPVPKDQVDVGLRAVTDWAKEIWADNLCLGRVAAVFHAGKSTTTMNRMRINFPIGYEGADTIVFRKPGFWGIWHDVAHLPPQQFWRAFGGTRIDFTWLTD
jgi:hypothetical protein